MDNKDLLYHSLVLMPNNSFLIRLLKGSHLAREHRDDVMATSRLSVHPNYVTATSEIKHPTKSRWNVAKRYRW